ncbi:MAG TPA: hypothetical protein P5201_11540, partial [Aminobacteriaceae bacterium]|nr:hypothetical protein [Aminobacteriaceae bacterium]
MQQREERKRRRDRTCQARADKPAHRQAGEEHHHHASEADGERGAEVGLEQHERHRQADQPGGRQQTTPVRGHRGGQVAVESREDEHDVGHIRLAREAD